MNKEKLMMQRSNMSAARKIQRVSQQQQHPVKYEQVKLNNRLATAKYDKKKREKRKLMSKEEVFADKLVKAEARRRQREQVKLNNRLATAKSKEEVLADRLLLKAEAKRRQRIKQKEKRNLMSKEKVLADKLLKAEARRRQRIKQKLKSLGLENVVRTLEVTGSDED